MLRVWGLVCRVLRLRCAVSILAILLPVLAGGLALGRGAQAQTFAGTVNVGSNPFAVAVNPVTNQVYVANQNSNSVTVIDGATNGTTNVTVGSDPDAVAVNPVTNQVYVANEGSNSVTVIDGATNGTTNVTVGSGPQAVAVNPVTNQVYVANASSGTVTVIDGATKGTTNVTVGSQPVAVAVNPVTNQVYVANEGSNSVTVIDGATNGTTNVTVGIDPAAVAVNPVTNQVYVANANSATVTVIDGATNGTTKVNVGSVPVAVAVNPVTNQVYVANASSNSVTVIDGATNGTTNVTVGSEPQAVAVNPVTNRVYVANGNSGTVTVIDGATNGTTNVTVGSEPFAVAVNPVTNQVYVANSDSNSVTVIDGATNGTTNVTVGSLPFAVAVNPVTNQVYVANQNSGTVTVIDGAANGTTNVTVGNAPVAVAVNPVTNQVYIANFNSGTVTVIDGAANGTTNVTVGSEPTAVAVNPVTNQVYVANLNSSTVTVIDGATNGTTNVTVGSEPAAVAVNPVTNRVYVANEESGTVTVIDGAINSTTSVNVGSVPAAVAVNPATNKVYVANANSGTVTVIDGATNGTTNVTVGSEPTAVAVNPVTNKVYVANADSNTVTVIDGATNGTTNVTVGILPFAVAVNPATNKVYVANQESGTVTVIDGATNGTTNVTVGSEPTAVAVNPVTNQVYVANQNSGTVTVIDSDGTKGQQTVPITVSTAAPVNDPLTVAAANATLGTPYITMNPSPLLTATVTSAYTASSVYVNDTEQMQTLENPPPTALYYQVDTGSGTWNQATVTSAAVANPAMFNIPLAVQTAGLHTVYLYAAYGDEGVPDSSGNGSGNSPEISNVAAFPFVVMPLPTTTALTADMNPQAPNANVTFTATVSSAAGTAAPTGVVTFFDAISGTPVQLGTGNLSVVSGSDIAELQTSFTATGSHPITAVYGGDAAHTGSTGSLTEIIGTLTLTPTTLPNPMVGVAYSETFTASGGTAPYTFSISAGALPGGLVLSGAGVLSGTATVVGTFNFTVMAKDSNGLTGMQAYSFTIATPAITLSPATLTSPTVGVAYSQTLAGSGGTAPYTFSISAGALPGGLGLSSGGVLSGTPTAGGTFSFTVTAKDQDGFMGSQMYSVTVGAPALLLSPVSGTKLTATGETPFSQTFAASGGTAPYSFTVPPGELPSGLMLSPAGVLSGTPTAGGPFSFTVTAKDSSTGTGPFTGVGTYTLTVSSPAISIAPMTLTSPTVGVTYNQTLTGSGGIAPYTFSISGGALPGGLGLSSGGVLSGTATAGGPFSFTVTVKDQDGFTVSQAYTVTVGAGAGTLSFAAIPPKTYGNPAFTVMASSASTGAITYSVSGPATINASTGAVTLTGAGQLMLEASQAATASYGSATAQTMVSVGKQASMTVVSASVASATPAQTVTLTAQVTPSVLGSPTGTVTFFDNGTALMSEPVTGGVAQLTTLLPAGATDVITATYSGDGNFLGGTSSNSATVMVVSLDFTFTNTGASSFTAAPGAVATYSFGLSPLFGNYAGTVSFSVAGLPAGAMASFTPSSVAAGGGATPVVMTVQTASATAQNKSNSPFGRGIVLAFLLLPLVAKRRVREKLKGRMLLTLLLMAGLTATLTGCGSTNGFLLQSPQTYTLTIAATSGTLQHSQTVTLTVQ
jgi:YVTN family beta-propeller protein